jgi:hypothetical protein
LKKALSCPLIASALALPRSARPEISGPGILRTAAVLTEDKAPLALARKGRNFGLQISPREFGRRFG